MLSLQITDIREFMSQLLTGDTFDRFFLVEAQVTGGYSLTLDGRRNRDFYDPEDPKARDPFLSWGELKHLVFAAVRGNRLPLSMKIILALPDSTAAALISRVNSSEPREDIRGMYVNILYSRGSLRLTTGISSTGFSLDRSLEYLFDDSVRNMLKRHDIL